MSLLNTKVLPALNGMKRGTVTAYEEVTNNNGGFLRVKFQLDDRTYDYIVFPKSVEYFTSALQTQLGKHFDNLGELLEDMKANKSEVSLWFSHHAQYGHQVALHDNTPRVIEKESEVEL